MQQHRQLTKLQFLNFLSASNKANKGSMSHNDSHHNFDKVCQGTRTWDHIFDKVQEHFSHHNLDKVQEHIMHHYLIQNGFHHLFGSFFSSQ